MVEEPRRADGTFVPGKSPNPGGQAKWLTEIRNDLRSLLPGAKTRLGAIIRDGSDKDATAAARVVLEYTVPKPRQTLKVSGDKNAPLSALLLEDLLALGRGVKSKKEDP